MDTVTKALEQYSSSGSEQYYVHKQSQKWRLIESYSFIEAILSHFPNGLAGLTVCDLGCGNGFYAKKCLALEAKFVLGYDLAPGMIELANQSCEDSQKEQYRVANILSMTIHESEIEQFDVVLVTYLWNYAPDHASLTQFIRQSARFLKPNGQMFVLTDNKKAITDYALLNHYGMYREPNHLPEKGDVDGTAIDYLFGTPDNHHRITNYRMSPQTLSDLTQAQGLSNLQWHPLLLPADLIDEAQAWEQFIQLEPITIFSLQKRA